ncbi:hypothetical protein CL654_02460 [bacterium]|nr:hypothetical protein [bacterium]|tara:strand:- start:6637 stop:7161 length:525 start_codon:yes stop_codon:yes gene_type:complete
MDFTLTDKDIDPDSNYSIPNKYKNRQTVKAIVINSRGEYGFVTNPKHGCYLLAGGGAESDDLEKEIMRECDEELNVGVKIVKKIGTAHEFRNKEERESVTTCFFVKVLKELPKDTRTEEEKENNLKPVWIQKGEALKVLSSQEEKVKKREISFYNTTFNIVRDARFFREHLKYL